MKLFNWVFSGGNYHYITTDPCDKCGEPTELTLPEEDYQAYVSLPEIYDGNHLICPRDVV